MVLVCLMAYQLIMAYLIPIPVFIYICKQIVCRQYRAHLFVYIRNMYYHSESEWNWELR